MFAFYVNVSAKSDQIEISLNNLYSNQSQNKSEVATSKANKIIFDGTRHAIGFPGYKF